MTEFAAFTAWLGAALIVLSDGRRALALGLALTAAAFAVLAWPAGGWGAAAAILVGGLIAATRRLWSGSPGWDVMPSGSTPRLILSVVAGLLALWFAASITTGDGAPLRFATLAVVCLMGTRVLTGKTPSIILTAIAVLALAAAVASGLAPGGPGPAPYFAAAVIAGGLSFLPMAESGGT